MSKKQPLPSNLPVNVKTQHDNVDTLSLHLSELPAESGLTADNNRLDNSNKRFCEDAIYNDSIGHSDMNSSLYTSTTVLPSIFFILGIMLMLSVIH